MTDLLDALKRNNQLLQEIALQYGAGTGEGRRRCRPRAEHAGGRGEPVHGHGRPVAGAACGCCC